ncbi:hypothetical protein B296_00024626 [Ensete ventricosum]|uniref:Uncharacterized protein n=1 Tax=Ensete ventricosum TaxID=4639 RepID=A0A426ZTU8_ENSVE|nr:hypothetical protein B296_00024626 [Ensete ventricosum]
MPIGWWRSFIGAERWHGREDGVPVNAHAAAAACKRDQSCNESSVPGQRRLGVVPVPPLIEEAIVFVRATDHGTGDDVRIRCFGVSPCPSTSARVVAAIAGGRSTSVAHMLRVSLPIAYQITHIPGIGSQDIVDLHEGKGWAGGVGNSIESANQVE